MKGYPEDESGKTRIIAGDREMHQAEKEQTEIGDGGRQEIFLPGFCSIRAVFAVVVTTELLAMVLTLADERPLTQFWQTLSVNSLLLQWIALGTAGMLCLLRRRLPGLGNRWAGLLAWGLLLCATVVVIELSQLVSGHGLSPERHLELLLKSLGISAIIGVVVLRYLYLQYLWRQQVEAENAARLQALQSRIRPHFLFNSMNTIASLTRSNPRLAEEVVEDLADLFRASLGDVRRLSTLGRELELARQYLNVERQRLGERLRVEWDLEELPESAMLPSLILQPLLENAVYHGIEPAAEGGVVRIVGRYRRRRVNLSIRNTLPQSTATSQRKGNSLALENVRQRLAGLFDTEAGLSESKVEGEHQVRLFFPHPWRLE
ncbi:sensor histidine kinase [bacterium endosymbiont of Escarpia laminata]|nr:MAG: sensor histidine kinase [bacterium endosymbiont of Escarpia laminata]